MQARLRDVTRALDIPPSPHFRPIVILCYYGLKFVRSRRSSDKIPEIYIELVIIMQWRSIFGIDSDLETEKEKKKWRVYKSDR